MEQEVWKDIIGYEGCYQVSDMGRVRSLDRFVEKTATYFIGQNRRNNAHYGETLRKGNIVAMTKNHKGYCLVGLTKNGKQKYYSVHRIVAIHFIPNPENKPQVNHKFGIKDDNRATELEWMTQGENMIHSYRVLGTKHNCTGRLGSLHPTSKKTLQIKDGEVIAEFGSAKEAERKTGIKRQNICTACLTEGKMAGGYEWKFESKVLVNS